MSNKKFDIYDYVHNNKFELNTDKETKSRDAKKTFKGYNDIRKTILTEAKVKDGKFSLEESLKGANDDKKPLSTEVKKHFLEIISTYNTYQEQMRRQSDIIEVAQTLGGIVEAARELTLNEADDWFDKVTIKRNMKQLEKLEKDFDKVANEAKSLDTRMQALYEDMGHILNRYYEVSDIDPQVMRDRLGQKEKSVTESVKIKPTGKKDSWGRPIYKDSKGNIYKDIELGKGKQPDIHTVTKGGEPNSRVKDFTIEESKKKKKKKKSYKEIMLGERSSDIMTYSAEGDRYDGGMVWTFHINNKEVHSDIFDGDGDFKYKNKTYTDFKKYVAAIAKDHGVKKVKRK